MPATQPAEESSIARQLNFKKTSDCEENHELQENRVWQTSIKAGGFSDLTTASKMA